MAPAREIDRYELLRRLGEGGAGEAWLAAAADGSRVVLKKARPGDQESRRAVADEFERVAALEHPGIARALDFVAEPDGTPVAIVFEAAGGEPSSVACRVATPAAMLGWAAGIAETLDYLHNTGLVHGDIKPDNVLIDARGVPRLIDFGLARAPGEARGGTARSVAPEVLAGRGGDELSDLFSLGATIHLWLLRRYPFGESLTQRLRSLDARIATPHLDGAPPGAGELLAALLAPRPEERPASAREVARLLAGLGAALPDPALADPAARERSLPLSGRDAACAAIGSAWTGSPGKPALLALVGPGGSGRTRLLELAARRARRAGRFVAFPHRDDTRPPGTALLDALADRGLAPRPTGRVPLPVALATLADSLPATVLLDDVQSYDESERAGLAELAEKIPFSKDLVVLLGTSRGHIPTGWTEIPLPPLDDDGVSRLTRDLLPGHGLPDGLARRIRLETDGRPGAVVSLLLEGARREIVRIERGGWSLAPLSEHDLSHLGADSAPREGALLESLRMSERALHAAMIAAGAPEPVSTLTAVAGLEAREGAAAARRLVAIGFARRSHDGRLRANGSAAEPDDLARAHKSWLERLGKERAKPVPRRIIAHLGRLARHAAGSGRPQLAARLALRAVRRAFAHGLLDEGTTALAAVSSVGVDEGIGRLELARAELARGSGRVRDALARYRAASERLVREGAPREAMRARAKQIRCMLETGENSSARALLAETNDSDPPGGIRARFEIERGLLAVREHDLPRALAAFNRAVACSEAASRVRARAHAARGRCLVLAGRAAEARRDLSLARAHEQSDASLHVAIEIAELQAARLGGDLRAVLDQSPRLATVMLARGDLEGLGTTAALASDAARTLGALDESLEHAMSSLRWRRLSGRADWLDAAHVRLANIHLLRGEFDAARGDLRRLDRSSAGSATHVAARITRARIACAEEDAGRAVLLARRALAAARAHGVPGAIAEALVTHGAARLLAGRHDAAIRALDQALGICRRLNPDAGIGPDAGIEAEALAMRAEAELQANPARAMHLASRARALASRAGEFDAETRAIAAESTAAEALGQPDTAIDLRRWNVSRLEEAAARCRPRTVRTAFLARPDRVRLAGRSGGIDARRLDALHGIAAAMAQQREPGRVLELLMDEALRLLGAERGAIVLASAGGTLSVRLARGIEPETAEGAIDLSRTILDRARGGESILAADPTSDDRFTSVESVRMFSISAVMCVPLRHRGESVGAVYVDSRDPGRRYDDADLRFLETLAHHAAIALANARAFDALSHENERLRADLGRRDGFGPVVGRSRAMQRVFRRIEMVSPQSSTVVIVGESGTGKELVARTIHRLGGFSDGPFVALNCAAIPDGTLQAELFGHEKGAFTSAEGSRVGLIERASGGTLFLDEISDMSPVMQSALLGVLEHGRFMPIGSSIERVVPFRLIAATTHPLDRLVAEGRLRRDLLYRIDVLTVELPPLRDRLDDIPLLVAHLLREIDPGRPRRASAALLDRLALWHWPGNVRELRNVLERVVLRTGSATLDVADLASEAMLGDRFETGDTSAHRMERAEEEAIVEALKFTNGNLARAAKLLGIGRATVYRKVRQYRIDVPAIRGLGRGVSS